MQKTASPHWRWWLGTDARCRAGIARIAKSRGRKIAGNAWLTLAANRPAFSAVLWVPAWTSVRKPTGGPTTDDLFSFLTYDPNEVMAPTHLRDTPVIMTVREDFETWRASPFVYVKILPLDEKLLARTE